MLFGVFLALNKTVERLAARGMKLDDFNYTSKDIADEIYSAMNSTSFLGVSVSLWLYILKFNIVDIILIENMHSSLIFA